MNLFFLIPAWFSCLESNSYPLAAIIHRIFIYHFHLERSRSKRYFYLVLLILSVSSITANLT